MTGLNVNWEQIGSILVLLFVISLVFETALTPIFNWRFFAKYCEGKGALIQAVPAARPREDMCFEPAMVASHPAVAEGTSGRLGVIEEGRAECEARCLARLHPYLHHCLHPTVPCLAPDSPLAPRPAPAWHQIPTAGRLAP